MSFVTKSFLQQLTENNRDFCYFQKQVLELAKVYVTAQPTFTSLKLQFT